MEVLLFFLLRVKLIRGLWIIVNSAKSHGAWCSNNPCCVDQRRNAGGVDLRRGLLCNQYVVFSCVLESLPVSRSYTVTSPLPQTLFPHGSIVAGTELTQPPHGTASPRQTSNNRKPRPSTHRPISRGSRPLSQIILVPVSTHACAHRPAYSQILSTVRSCSSQSEPSHTVRLVRR